MTNILVAVCYSSIVSLAAALERDETIRKSDNREEDLEDEGKPWLLKYGDTFLGIFLISSILTALVCMVTCHCAWHQYYSLPCKNERPAGTKPPVTQIRIQKEDYITAHMDLESRPPSNSLPACIVVPPGFTGKFFPEKDSLSLDETHSETHSEGFGSSTMDSHEFIDSFNYMPRREVHLTLRERRMFHVENIQVLEQLRDEEGNEEEQHLPPPQQICFPTNDGCDCDCGMSDDEQSMASSRDSSMLNSMASLSSPSLFSFSSSSSGDEDLLCDSDDMTYKSGGITLISAGELTVATPRTSLTLSNAVLEMGEV